MRRVLTVLALFLCLGAGFALAFPGESPCGAPRTGTAYPCDPNTGALIPGGTPVPFHLDELLTSLNWKGPKNWLMPFVHDGWTQYTNWAGKPPSDWPDPTRTIEFFELPDGGMYAREIATYAGPPATTTTTTYRVVNP